MDRSKECYVSLDMNLNTDINRNGSALNSDGFALVDRKTGIAALKSDFKSDPWWYMSQSSCVSAWDGGGVRLIASAAFLFSCSSLCEGES